MNIDHQHTPIWRANFSFYIIKATSEQRPLANNGNQFEVQKVVVENTGLTV